MTKGNIALKSLVVAFAATAAIGGVPQAKLAPEATTAHIPTLEAECLASITIHEKATCLVLDGIQLARN